MSLAQVSEMLVRSGGAHWSLDICVRKSLLFQPEDILIGAHETIAPIDLFDEGPNNRVFR